MAENPFEKMVDQFYKLVEILEQAKSKEINDLPPDIEEKLTQIEQGIKLFKLINSNALNSAGLTEADLKRILGSSTLRQGKDRSILERAKKLRKVLGEMENKYRVEYQISKRRDSIYGKKAGTQNVARSRKKKFKRLGGDDWVPL